LHSKNNFAYYYSDKTQKNNINYKGQSSEIRETCNVNPARRYAIKITYLFRNTFLAAEHTLPVFFHFFTPLLASQGRLAFLGRNKFN
jgi:hypothetical protein